jgi:hypothetical protein
MFPDRLGLMQKTMVFNKYKKLQAQKDLEEEDT